MVKITKVYTRQGDSGETHLGGGTRIAKDSTRIQAVGEIDELNAMLGHAICSMEFISDLSVIVNSCIRIQNELFNLGAELTVLPEKRRENTPTIELRNIDQLEKEIDQFNKALSVLTSFVLPGGGEVSTRLHLARTVCRRAERSMVALSKEAQNLDGVELPYINRLSDWLFVAARYTALKLNKRELLWQH